MDGEHVQIPPLCRAYHDIAGHLSADSRGRAHVLRQGRGWCLWLSSAAVVVVVVESMTFLPDDFDDMTGRLGKMDVCRNTLPASSTPASTTVVHRWIAWTS